MGHPPIDGGSGRRPDDRLSNLGDVVLGHILSFLDAKEAARAAVLSSRWRDVFACVHTISLDLPERPEYACDNTSWYNHHKLRPFVASVNAALFSRSRRPAPAAGAVPLRALRVSIERDVKNYTVDRWVSYALRHAASEFELDLRLEPDPVCYGPHRFADSAARGVARDEGRGVSRHFNPYLSERHKDAVVVNEQPPAHLPCVHDNEDDDAASSEEEKAPLSRERQLPPVYTVPMELFSCPALRALRLSSCRLSPPAAISLPALEALHLTYIDEEEDVQRLILACPRLADLTVESCRTVTELYLLDNTRLRRLALRFCHKLTTVSVDATELRSFEYVGAVPENSFLNLCGGGGLFRSLTSCKIDIWEDASFEEAFHSFPHPTSERITDCATSASLLATFLDLFVSTKHLHLSSARMGEPFRDLREFPAVRHLELNGCVPHDDDPAIAPAVTSTVLCQVPNLEVLTLYFEKSTGVGPSYRYSYSSHGRRSEGELLDVHLLHYNHYETLDYYGPPVPPCLQSRVRKINLVHYQGGKAQRTLAKFLLDNSLALEMLYCGFAEGPEWIQMELKRELEGWVRNETADKEFH